MIKWVSLKLPQSYKMTKSVRIFLFSILCSIFYLLSLNICRSDTVYLDGSDRAISLRVEKVTEKYIIATIKKKQVNNISIRPDASKMFPDTVYFMSNLENKVRCKIIVITDNVYAIKLPMSNIESLEISQKKNDDHEDGIFSRAGDLPNVPTEKSQIYKKEDLLDLELLEEMEFDDINTKDQIAEPNALMREALTDFEINSHIAKMEGPSSEIDPDRLKEEIKKELMDAMNKQKKEQEERFLIENTGKVSGKIFRNGKPFQDCNVKIVALTEERSLFSKQIKRGEQLETITDEYGKYYFENVSPGSYKLFWKPPYETSWIRRLDMKPDVIVTAGTTTFPKTVEINKRVLN